MSDVKLLWFECANTNCNYIPLVTKKAKIKYAWSRGKSVMKSARRRLFLKYVDGHILNSEGLTFFHCKYGKICLFDALDYHQVNSQIHPIRHAEICGVCSKRNINRKLLLGHE